MEKLWVSNTVNFVKKTLKDAEGGHDWFHTLRVYHNAKTISKSENCNGLVVQLASLLHDIADSKFHHGDEAIGPKTARLFLESQQVDVGVIEHVVKIIENISFKGGRHHSTFCSKELEVVQDADRLDAMGAIGIGRAFSYGGYKNRLMYDPDITPNLQMTKEEYKNSTAPTINHFYEKLLRLKDLMNTQKGKEMAMQRHEYMLGFLKQFYKEFEGDL